MNMVKKFKDLVVGDVIYGFKIDQDYNAPGDICTVEVLDINMEDDLLTIYTSMKSGNEAYRNEAYRNEDYYVYFETESDLSIDRLVETCFATTEEEIKALYKECIEESINLHESSISELRSLYLKHHGRK